MKIPRPTIPAWLAPWLARVPVPTLGDAVVGAFMAAVFGTKMGWQWAWLAVPFVLIGRITGAFPAGRGKELPPNLPMPSMRVFTGMGASVAAGYGVAFLLGGHPAWAVMPLALVCYLVGVWDGRHGPGDRFRQARKREQATAKRRPWHDP